ncbi:T9SS type A sorting domain-containing protein [Candidatus Neomarinimicrobiota bacterium]
MKNGLLQFLLIPCIFVAAISAQTIDITLQEQVTPDYITYLAEKEATWLAQVGIGGDTPETMKAHLGLAVLAFAWSHVDADSQLADIDLILEDISDNAANIGDRITQDLLPILFLASDQDTFFTMLIDFFESGDYVEFRDSMATYLENIGAGVDETMWTLDSLFANIEDNFAQENFQDHLDYIVDGTADFEFRLQVNGGEYNDSLFVFTRTLFNRWEALEDIGAAMANDFDNGGSWMDSVMTIPGGDVMPGVAYFRSGLDKADTFIDTLKVILTNDPFTPFDISVSDLDSLKEAIAEADTLLGGKEYGIGPDVEAKTIKPLAIIMNMPDNGLWDLYQDFYRTSDPASYTFGGIFPAGLPSDALELIAADAIVNEDDDEDAFYDRFMVLKAGWLEDIVTDPADPDAHLGIALVSFYEMIRNHEEVYADVFRLLDDGRIDSLAFYYDWSDVDLFDEMEEIDYHLEQYVNADEPEPFFILVKTNETPIDPYIIAAGSEFDIIPLWVTDVAMVRVSLNLARTAAEMVVEGIGAIYDELSDVFVFDLNPAVLDFSQVENDSALILMLETSNPNFLTLTPYGVYKFIEAGDELEQGFEQLGIFFDHMTDLATAIAPYDEDFGIDSEIFISEMTSASEGAWELYADFATPEAVTMIDGERVNFSAWFDDPPQSFLLMWKNYVFSIDSTLGGLFPDRWAVGIATDPDIAPKEFALHPNYPNPFNPTTQIVFDLPISGKVSLAIYNVKGQEVSRLLDEYMEPGRKVMTWDAAGLPSGIYICHLECSGNLISKKMMLIK